MFPINFSKYVISYAGTWIPWPATAATTEAKEKVGGLFRDDRRITTNELCAAIGTGKLAVMVIIRELGY
jgi:hypothetical protein